MWDEGRGARTIERLEIVEGGGGRHLAGGLKIVSSM